MTELSIRTGWPAGWIWATFSPARLSYYLDRMARIQARDRLELLTIQHAADPKAIRDRLLEAAGLTRPEVAGVNGPAAVRAHALMARVADAMGDAKGAAALRRKGGLLDRMHDAGILPLADA